MVHNRDLQIANLTKERDAAKLALAQTDISDLSEADQRLVRLSVQDLASKLRKLS
jgi:uncharacterized protein YacL